MKRYVSGRNDILTLNFRGFTHLKLGELSHSVEDFDAALKVDPKSAVSLYGRGLAKQKKGDAPGGNEDMEVARMIRSNIAEEIAVYGVK